MPARVPDCLLSASLKVWPPGECHRKHEAVTDLANGEDIAGALGREQIQRGLGQDRPQL